MSWDKIENHLFSKYDVEGEDKELSNFMEEHDKQIRAKAIDEFVKTICKKYTEEEHKGNCRQYCASIKQDIADIAEQMKAGGIDG